MPITRTIMTDDDGTGTTGTILNNAWLQTIYGQVDALVAPWVPVPFSAANFTASGSGTWTVTGTQACSTCRIGALMTVLFQTSLSTVGGTPYALNVTIPGLLPTLGIGMPFNYAIAGVAGVGYGTVTSPSPMLALFRDVNGTPWTAGQTTIVGSFTFAV